MTDKQEIDRAVSPLDLARTLRELDEESTVAPWCEDDGMFFTTDSYGMPPYVPIDLDGHNGDLIVALRNNLPALLDALLIAAAVDEWFGERHVWIRRRAAELKASLEQSR